MHVKASYGMGATLANRQVSQTFNKVLKNYKLQRKTGQPFRRLVQINAVSQQKAPRNRHGNFVKRTYPVVPRAVPELGGAATGLDVSHVEEQLRSALQHQIAVSSVVGFFSTLHSQLQGMPELAGDSLPLSMPDMTSITAAAASGLQRLTDDLSAVDHHSVQVAGDALMGSAGEDFLGAAVSSAVKAGEHLLDLQNAAVLAPVMDAAAAVGSDLQSAAALQDLASWAGSKIAILQAVDPESVAVIKDSIGELLTGLSGFLDANAAAETQQLTNGLVLGMQQLMMGLHMPDVGGLGSIEAMAAAQESLAASASSGNVGLETMLKIVIGVFALMMASVPKEAVANFDKYGSGAVPERYDPDQLADYFSRRPVAVVKRNAQVLSEIVKWATAVLGASQRGATEKEMPAHAKMLRHACERLGPCYVKVAQSLGTRVDLLPPAYIEELAQLQDNVTPFSTVEARQVLEHALGQPVDGIFEWLSAEPLAAASLGQVYRGKLQDNLGGAEVAVKVQRPGILEGIALDVFLMRRAARILSKLPNMNEGWEHILDDWAFRFFCEMDYNLEARNTMTFRQQMLSVKAVKVAEVYPELTSRFVIVTEWLEGMKLSDCHKEDVRPLVTPMLNCWLIQLLETGFLHADPHPGNLMCTTDGHLAVLDFGLMTELNEEQRILCVEYIAHLMLEDWEGVARDLDGFGFFPHGIPPDQMHRLVPIMKRLMGNMGKRGGMGTFIDVTTMAGEMEEVARDFQMIIPPYFGLVVRAFSTLEGVALAVDPEYGLVQETLPYLSRRLLTDNNPRMRAALRSMLYGNKTRIDVERLQKLLSAFTSFSTAAGAPTTPQAIGVTFSSAVNSENIKGRPSAFNWDDEPPIMTEALKEGLRLVFSKEGSYAQELVVEELVASVDAMSREALGEALQLVLASSSAVTVLQSVEALGPLRGMLLPIPAPMQMLQGMRQGVALSKEDHEALGTIRAVLALMQPTLLQLPTIASNGRVAVKVCGELLPMMPELLPGVQATMEMFLKQLVRRMALRLAEELDPAAAAAAHQAQARPPQPML